MEDIIDFILRFLVGFTLFLGVAGFVLLVTTEDQPITYLVSKISSQ